MEVLVLQVFVSLLLVVGSVVLLAYSVKHADHEHADRLALFPIEDESRPAPQAGQPSETVPGPNVGEVQTGKPGQAG